MPNSAHQSTIRLFDRPAISIAQKSSSQRSSAFTRAESPHSMVYPRAKAMRARGGKDERLQRVWACAVQGSRARALLAALCAALLAALLAPWSLRGPRSPTFDSE